MARFYNPYHFVPVEKRSAAQGVFEDKIQKEGDGNRRKWDRSKRAEATHERYVAEAHSGRLIVRLTTVTPVAIGSEQERANNKSYAKVEPYRAGVDVAIPASSLRGLTGSVVEAATNGPMRVLEDRIFSYRRRMDQGLSAIGLIVERNGELKLKPMCLPTLESRDGGKTFPVPPEFRRVFPVPQFKVFFGEKEQIRDMHFPYRTHVAGTLPVDMPVKQLGWLGTSIASDRTLHVKGGRFAVAQIADARDPGRPGKVRVLGCWGDREDDMPPTKKHELWIPEPHPQAPELPIADYALERFYALADERTQAESRLPFEPRDTRPDPDARGAGKKFRLRDGDLVYFNVDSSGHVTEISLSAIWRGRVELPSSHEAAGARRFFGQVDKELLPFSEQRETISAAERLFGFVEERIAKQDIEQAGIAFASRLRFSDAVLPPGAGNVLMAPTKLKILGSPKTPCPAMYFRARTGDRYIGKQELSPENHIPQGRKWYLHAKPGDATPWKTEKPHESQGQKNQVEPIRPGVEFFFHIDFDNLTDWELGLILFAIEPDPRFHHKIGMGKPLGLGSIKLEVLGCFTIDRAKRYSIEGLQAERYSGKSLTTAGENAVTAGAWPVRYTEERNTTAIADVIGAARTVFSRNDVVPRAVRSALRLLGDYESAPAAQDVHYPTIADQRDKETEHFKWFVFNDGHRERGRGMSPNNQSLARLGNVTQLPTLQEPDWDSGNGRER